MIDPQLPSTLPPPRSRRRDAAPPSRSSAWVLVLAAGLVRRLAPFDYGTRDADSRLYAEMAARMSVAPAAEWIAPDFPPGWYMTGLYREHPVGLFVPAALLARLGYPAEQAAYAVNAVYQVLTIVLDPAAGARPWSRASRPGPWAG